MLETFTLETFTPLIGSHFELTEQDDKALRLELVEANATGPSAPTAVRDPFSLSFLGPGEPLLAQATYPVSHPMLGTFELFIVPTGHDHSGTRYEAVFS